MSKRDNLFDWLVRRAEADLGVAQALAAGETQRADQIKRLETTLIGQISKLQHQIIESRDAELNDLKSEIFACADRIARFEGTQSTADVAKQVIQELGDLRGQLSARQTELESRYSGFEKLGESLGAHIRALEEELRNKLDGIRNAQAEMRHFQSETQSLAERVAHAESASWQARTLALRNAQQLDQSVESLRGEIVALNALFADFNDKQRDPDTVLKEVIQNLSTNIEQIQDRLTQTHSSQVERDLRLGQLHSGLAMLAERVTRAESLAQRTQATAQAEANSASDFRKTTVQELAALRAKLSEPAVHPKVIEELESSLRAKTEPWQHQTAQKFMLLDSRDAEREKSARELASTLAAKLEHQEARSDDKLRALETRHEELRRLLPEVQTLAQRIAGAESATQRAQACSDAIAERTAHLEDTLKSEIAAVNAEFAKLADQQRAFRLPEDQLCEIERKLAVTIEDIQRQLAREREGFDYWGKGLRESFGAELSAVQARLSERQSQLEHRYARLEHWEESVKATLDGLETQLTDKLQSCALQQQAWDILQPQLGMLGERTSQLETRARQAEDRVAAMTRDTEQSVAALQSEISAIEIAIARRKLPSPDFVIPAIEEKLGSRLGEIEERFTSQLSQYKSRDGERARQSEQIINGVQNELAVLKTALDAKQSTAPSDPALSPSVEESLRINIRELDQRVAARCSQIDARDAVRAQETNNFFAALQCELAEIKNAVNQRTAMPAEASMRGLEDTIGTQMQEFQQHVAQKLSRLETLEAARTQQAEQAIAGVKSEIAALNRELIQRPAAMSPADPALCGLEDKLSAKIEEVRQQMEQKITALDSHEADLRELKERSQSLIQRVTQLSSIIQSSQNTLGTSQPMSLRPDVSAPLAPAGKAQGDDNLAEIQAHREKEQLIKLQERMSSEIERVRAELKERSGRWKVRKSAS